MKTDKQVYRQALRTMGAFVIRGLLPRGGYVTLGRTTVLAADDSDRQVAHRIWLARLEPAPEEGEEWKG